MRERLTLAALVLAAAVPLLFIGDVPWINDEPKLFALALDANAQHALAEAGLQGTVGMVYGPVGVWFYQALLGVSRDLLLIAFLHALVMSGCLLVAVVWLSRALDLWRPFGVTLLLSPYLWFYDRSLWDNSLLLPLGGLALAAAADYFAHRHRAALVTSLFLLAPMPLVHFMALAFVVPMLAHLAIAARRDWPWFWGAAVASTALIVAAAWPYLGVAVAMHPAAHAQGDFASGFFFPLLGGQLLGATGFGYFWKQCAAPGSRWLACFTAGGVALVWLGLIIAVRAARHAPSAKRSMARLALSIVAAQALLDGVTHSFFHPHYFNATWSVFAFLAWLAIDALPAAWRARLAVFHGAALAIFLVVTIATIHLDHGDRGIHYGATLANQIEVAEGLHGATPVIAVENYRAFPQALDVLRRFFPAPDSGQTVRLDYAAANRCDGRIVLAPP